MLYVAASLILDAVALDRQGYFYSLTGTLAIGWEFANLFYDGPSHIIMSLGFNPQTDTFVPYYLSTADGISLGAFVLIVFMIGAVITIDMNMRKPQGPDSGHF